LTFLEKLECTRCKTSYSPDQPHNLCTCGAPLFARYRLQEVKKKVKRKDILDGPPNIWRYREVLPITEKREIVSLGEGFTPLIRAYNLGRKLGLENLWMKDESLNPTGSFKARGMSVAISMAKKLGIKEVCLPSAGNAAGAAAAYSTRAKIKAFVFMPQDTDPCFVLECKSYNAQVELVEGVITDCAARMLERKKGKNWFDLSTLKEPYRVEGKKTMGYELAEQLGWELPDVIIYPTGGGTGIIGMWKAFEELQSLGWVKGKKPRLVCVQSEGCAPLVKAFKEGKEFAQEWKNPETFASGIKVPKAIGDFLILKALRESHGTALAVPDQEILKSLKEISETEGILPCPEGAATLVALKRLKEKNKIESDEKIVIFNTGTGLKYIESLKKFFL
jgi:threonine synthase